MIWAIKNNERIKALPKQKALCPICNEEVISKCGSIKIWHWSHKSNKDCDNWWEPETEWHINWKNEFPKECQEIIIGKHRADIKTNYTIIELQNSSISTKEIQEREEFYKNMIWLLNGKNLAKGLDLRKKKEVFTFRWKNPPKSWWIANKPIYIHLKKQLCGECLIDNKIFLIKKIYNNIPCGGWGYLISKEDFLKKFR